MRTVKLVFRALFVLFLLTGIAFSHSLSGQETETFKPGGKAEVRIFSSLYSTFSDGLNHTKFDIGRAYLGYSHNFSKNLMGRVVYDVADPSTGKLKFTGMLKFGYLRYQKGKLAIAGGMIPLPEYDFGDKKWGYRYVYKPSHDEYGFGVAADIGLSVAYDIAPWATVDAVIMNGEGFKLTEADSTLKIAGGISLTPAKNLSFRIYLDNMGKNSINQQSIEFIAAYENRGLVISGAFNSQKNHGMIDGQDYRAFSFNGTVPVNKYMKLFGRYDNVKSSAITGEENPWNLAKDGQLFIAGIEFNLASGVNLSPNYQGWKPAGANMPFISRFALSLDIKI